MEYLDLALDYLKANKPVTLIAAGLFILLLIRNFWFIIKLLVILALIFLAIFVAFSLLQKTDLKKDIPKSHKKTSQQSTLNPPSIGYPRSRTLPPKIGIRF